MTKTHEFGNCDKTFEFTSENATIMEVHRD